MPHRPLNEAEIDLLLAQLPHVAPPDGFADRVLARVRAEGMVGVNGATDMVGSPHNPGTAQALLTWIRRLAPRSRPLRALAGAAAALVALSMSVITVWLALRIDIVFWAFDFLGARVRTQVAHGITTGIDAMLGSSALGLFGGTTTGATASAIAAGTVAGLTIVAIAGVAWTNPGRHPGGAA